MDGLTRWGAALLWVSVILGGSAVLAEGSQVPAPATLQIDKWCSFGFVAGNPSIDLHVEPSMFGQRVKASNAIEANLELNFSGYLVCPERVLLTDHGTYEASANCLISSGKSGKVMRGVYARSTLQGQPGSYRYALEPGQYLGFDVEASIDQVWDAKALAGFYTTANAGGTPLVLTVTDQP